MERGEEGPLQNRFPGKTVSLRATRSGPRLEFLTAAAFFGTSDSLVSTKAYFDTLASFSFLSVPIFDKLRTRDTNALGPIKGATGRSRRLCVKALQAQWTVSADPVPTAKTYRIEGEI
eukprot:scaffold357_cov424-Pavlova_lutheri.AAC.3